MRAAKIAWWVAYRIFEIIVILFVLFSLHDRSLSIIVSILCIIYSTMITLSVSHATLYWNKLNQIDAVVLQIKKAFAEASREPVQAPTFLTDNGFPMDKFYAQVASNFVVFFICLANIFISL